MLLPTKTPVVVNTIPRQLSALSPELNLFQASSDGLCTSVKSSTQKHMPACYLLNQISLAATVGINQSSLNTAIAFPAVFVSDFGGGYCE
ncbi:uncharacterized protein METZ01_LOCUS426705 [marine metagenome]|uniref:Uncharacterized protein n=1 Tax=marine metagenome TaxID=408172 RepID=A0A382XTP4_9ZZZZ